MECVKIQDNRSETSSVPTFQHGPLVFRLDMDMRGVLTKLSQTLPGDFSGYCALKDGVPKPFQVEQVGQIYLLKTDGEPIYFSRSVYWNWPKIGDFVNVWIDWAHLSVNKCT